MRIVYLKMGYRSDLSDLGPPGAPNRDRHLEVLGVGQQVKTPDGREGRILIRDTWGTDVIDALKPFPDVIVVYTHRFSGFYKTESDAILKKIGVNTLWLRGARRAYASSQPFETLRLRPHRPVRGK
jgi:ureidoacrylate peracid hydrolase